MSIYFSNSYFIHPKQLLTVLFLLYFLLIIKTKDRKKNFNFILKYFFQIISLL